MFYCRAWKSAFGLKSQIVGLRMAVLSRPHGHPLFLAAVAQKHIFCKPSSQTSVPCTDKVKRLTYSRLSVSLWFMFKLTWACSPHHCPIDKSLPGPPQLWVRRARGAGYLALWQVQRARMGALQVVSTAAHLRHYRDTAFLVAFFLLLSFFFKPTFN